MPGAARVRIALIVMASAASLPARAVEEGQGFVELRGAASLGVSGEHLQFVERVRPTFTAPLRPRIKLVATIEAALTDDVLAASAP